MAIGAVRRELVALAVPAAACGLTLAWALAHPAGPNPSAATAAVGLLCGVTVFGLTLLPLSIGPVGVDLSRLVTVVAGMWMVAAVLTAWFEVADRTGRGVAEVGLGEFFTVSRHGLPAIISAGCALAVVAWALWRSGSGDGADWRAEGAGAVAGVGLLIGPVTGHLGQHAGGSIVIAVHVLAASWWCGTLAALALTVRGRGGWARTLPVFSRRAAWCVGLLLVSGVVAAALQLDSPADLGSTGYGRVVLAKAVGLTLLFGVAWWQRSTWVPAAAAHRMGADGSLRRAVIEIGAMAAVLGLASGLAATALR